MIVPVEGNICVSQNRDGLEIEGYCRTKAGNGGSENWNLPDIFGPEKVPPVIGIATRWPLGPAP